MNYLTSSVVEPVLFETLFEKTDFSTSIIQTLSISFKYINLIYDNDLNPKVLKFLDKIDRNSYIYLLEIFDNYSFEYELDKKIEKSEEDVLNYHNKYLHQYLKAIYNFIYKHKIELNKNEKKLIFLCSHFLDLENDKDKELIIKMDLNFPINNIGDNFNRYQKFKAIQEHYYLNKNIRNSNIKKNKKKKSN